MASTVNFSSTPTTPKTMYNTAGFGLQASGNLFLSGEQQVLSQLPSAAQQVHAHTQQQLHFMTNSRSHPIMDTKAIKTDGISKLA